MALSSFQRRSSSASSFHAPFFVFSFIDDSLDWPTCPKRDPYSWFLRLPVVGLLGRRSRRLVLIMRQAITVHASGPPDSKEGLFVWSFTTTIQICLPVQCLIVQFVSSDRGSQHNYGFLSRIRFGFCLDRPITGRLSGSVGRKPSQVSDTGPTSGSAPRTRRSI